jgi:hypothetical protein
MSFKSEKKMVKWVIPVRIAGIVTRLQAGKSGFLITAGARNFSLLQSVETGLGALPTVLLFTGYRRKAAGA